MSWLRRLSNTFRTTRLRRDIDRELAFHIAERADELRADGLSDRDALRRARLQFGNPAAHLERTRDVDVSGVLDAMTRNLRYAFRALRRTPGFTLTVVVTLALGIGANSAVFSAIDAILLRPLPFRDGERLVRIHEVRAQTGEVFAALPRVEDWNRLNTTFDVISAYSAGDGSDTTRDLPERTRYATVAPHFFEMLGVAPALGRPFTDADYRLGGPTTVVLSHRFWRDSADADPNVVGTTLRMKDVSGDIAFSIAGVMPETFLFLDRGVGAWSAARTDAPWFRLRHVGMSFWDAIGRLKPGVTLEQARADLARVQAQLANEYPDTDRDITLRITPLKDTVVGDVRSSLWLLFGAVSVLLLIACTNIAALLFARGAQREHEITVRYALGGSRATVAGQLLTEAAVLTLAGAAAGLVVATGAATAFRRLAPNLPRLDEVGVDPRILLYTIASAAGVAVLCGLFPAIRSTRNQTLARSTGTRVSARHSLQWLLVGIQVALSVTLLAGAGLLLRSFDKLSRVDTGFDTSHVLAFRVYGTWNETPDAILRRVNRTLDELSGLAGIEVTATSHAVPGVPGYNEFEFTSSTRRDPGMVAAWRSVSPSYFSAMRIPIVGGELCRRPVDLASRLSTGQAMVNRSFADRYFPGRSIIGLSLTTDKYTGQVVGVVGDSREVGLDHSPVPTVYACDPAPNPLPWYIVRTRIEPMAVASAVRLKMKDIEPLRAVYDISPLQDRIDDAYAQNRLRTVLLVLFGIAALSLACVGVYGTLSYVVSLRRREVGLRLALGAARGRILQQFLGQSMRVVGVACVCGLGLSLLVMRALSGMLFGVSPTDPVTFFGVVAIVLVVAVVAALIPATRAALMQPMRILREE